MESLILLMKLIILLFTLLNKRINNFINEINNFIKINNNFITGIDISLYKDHKPLTKGVNLFGSLI